jgi:hypothetical protein
MLDRHVRLYAVSQDPKTARQGAGAGLGGPGGLDVEGVGGGPAVLADALISVHQRPPGQVQKHVLQG